MDQLIILIARTLDKILNIIYFLLFARAIISWLPIPYRFHQIVEFLYHVTEPVLAPIRKLMERFYKGRPMMIDFSPIVAFFVIMLLQKVIWMIATLLLR